MVARQMCGRAHGGCKMPAALLRCVCELATSQCWQQVKRIRLAWPTSWSRQRPCIIPPDREALFVLEEEDPGVEMLRSCRAFWTSPTKPTDGSSADSERRRRPVARLAWSPVSAPRITPCTRSVDTHAAGGRAQPMPRLQVPCSRAPQFVSSQALQLTRRDTSRRRRASIRARAAARNPVVSW